MNFLGSGIDGIKIIEPENIVQSNEKLNFQIIDISKIRPGKYQPRNRKFLSEESLLELVISIKELGILQPIIVKNSDSGFYEIIAGERRYLAACRANYLEIPAIINDVDEKEAYAMAIIENIQRDQLSSLEQAEALFRFKESSSVSIEEIAKIIGKPRTTIANLIRVASLASVEAKKMCEMGLVEFGHIRAILTLDHNLQDKILQHVIIKKLTVRSTEHLVTSGNYQNILELNIKNSKEISPEIIDIYINKLSTFFPCPVKIRQVENGKIRVQLEFTDLNQISNYLEQFSMTCL